MQGCILNTTIKFDWKLENAGKPHFGPDLRLLDPNLGYTCFLEVSALLEVRHCPSYNPIQYQAKLMMNT